MRAVRLILAFFLLVLAGAKPAAAGEGYPINSNLKVPLDGLVFNVPGGEAVALSGRLHLVTHVLPTEPCISEDPCHASINLVDARGVGLSTGARYLVLGEGILPFVIPPTPVIPPSPVRATFALVRIGIPPSPIQPGPPPIVPITFAIELHFDDAGRLTADTSVQLAGSCTTLECSF